MFFSLFRTTVQIWRIPLHFGGKPGPFGLLSIVALFWHRRITKQTDVCNINQVRSVNKLGVYPKAPLPTTLIFSYFSIAAAPRQTFPPSPGNPTTTASNEGQRRRDNSFFLHTEGSKKLANQVWSSHCEFLEYDHRFSLQLAHKTQIESHFTTLRLFYFYFIFQKLQKNTI